MKKILSILFLVSLFACKKDTIPYSNELEESQQRWNNFKTSIKDSYSYINYSNSVFGAYTETKIIVQNGKVTSRIFTAGIYSQNSSQLNIREFWTEDATTLNTHVNGAKSITLDDIYGKAIKEWLSRDVKVNEVYFSTDTMGLISSCGYSEKACQDDCFVGVHIKAIIKL